MASPALEPLQASRIVLMAGLAWLVIVAQLLTEHWSETAHTLSDMDDAMRLVEVRAFLAGNGWFDLHEMRLGPPEGYDTHWSRLIDAGIAGLLFLFSQLSDAAFAERLVRAVWPMLWLIPSMAGAAAIAWRIAGRAAVPFSLLLTAVGLPAFQHFIPGRIDHHNVQIALSVLLVAATVWSDRVKWAALAAGVLTGAAMAIGFEGAPYMVLAGVALALRFVFNTDGARPLARYAGWTAASVAVAFGISVGPGHWGSTACDAIAVNSAAAVVAAALALVVSARSFAGAQWQVRAGAVSMCGLVAAAVFFVLEPRCLSGPFAMMDPTVREIWFNHVSEMRPLWSVATASPPMCAAVVAFPALAVAALLNLARDPLMRRDLGFVVTAAALLMACVVMVLMVRAYSYAVWLAIPLVAASALRLFAAWRRDTVVGRVLVALLLTPTVTSAVALAAVQAISRQPFEGENSRVVAGCLRIENYAGLANLPPGLIATDVDYGPFILALTPHSVMSAPYHRLGAPIIDAHRIFALPPVASRQVVERVRPTYLATCGRHTLAGIGEAERAASLWGRLAVGEIPDWLELVPETRNQPFVVYRVKL